MAENTNNNRNTGETIKKTLKIGAAVITAIGIVLEANQENKES